MSYLNCRECGNNFPLQEPRWRCDCGGLLDIDFEFNLDINTLKTRKSTLWRYREAIPVVKDDNIVSFDEGMTPLFPLEIDGKFVLIKLDYLFPTGSFKDRGASVLISKVKEWGIKKVAIDSSGNAGCAVSAYCARAGIGCEVYVPEYASPAKLTQMEMYGSQVHRISGTRDDCAQAVLEAAERIYYAGHTWNPFFHQGTKTFAYELWEQLKFNVPDGIIILTGSGSLLIGTYLGFKDLLRKNLIGKMPRLIAVQSENCAPIHKMFSQNLSAIPSLASKKTLAEGIAVAAPVRARQIVDIIRETEGYVITVSETEIKKAALESAKNGLYIEPTSAAAIAGFNKYRYPEERTVVPLTGHGLKAKYPLP